MPTGDLILQGFGLQFIKPKLFQEGEELGQSSASFNSQQSVSLPSPLTIKKNQKSVLGTPVFCDLLLQNELNQIYLDTILIDVTRQKTIVKTVLTGKQSTVKEYISSSDYMIEVKGMVHTFRSGNYPLADVQVLTEILDTNAAIKVVCPYLRLFNIYNIVVEEFKFPQRNGFENTQLFSFTAYSDEPIEFELLTDA